MKIYVNVSMCEQMTAI